MNLPRSFLTLTALLTCTLDAVQIHVSPQGKDDHPGTSELPLATPQAARDKARQVIQSGPREPIEILFAPGAYRLSSPLLLGPEDSGGTDAPVTWKAAAGSEVIWSGGIQLPAEWRRQDHGIWSIDLSSLLPANANFRQLFVNEQRAIRARFPNADAANPFLYATGGDKDHITVAPELVKPAWGTARDAQINIVPQWKFFNQWNTITKVDPDSGRIDIADSERHAKIIAGNWFWIEGVREELDQPGEWFFDIATRMLQYMPEPGTDPNSLAVVIPRLGRLVTAKGDINAGTHVRNIHFQGISFRHTDFTLGHIEARVHSDAAILFENTKDSSVSGCHFENIGGYALWLHLDSLRNRFDRNTVEHAGGGGVLMTGARFSYMDDTKIHTPGEAASKVFPILNEVTRNTVRHCGRIRYYGGGVHLDSRPYCMSMSPGNRISHNHFNDLSRNGIFAFRNQGGNVIEYNHIHNTMQTTIDGGCIHFATMNHLNAPNFILNNWLHDAWGCERLPDGTTKRKLANGIFLDWDTSNTTVRNNWIHNTVGGAIKPIWKNQNLTILDNHESETRAVPPFANEVGPDGRATNNIPLESTRLIGQVIHHSDSRHVRTSGAWIPHTSNGMWGLFRFQFLVGSPGDKAEAVYELPIAEEGVYEVSLLYQQGKDRADNASVAVLHADGRADLKWNMREGSPHGFSQPIGSWRFSPDKPARVIISTAGANGKVIADAVAFVKSTRP